MFNKIKTILSSPAASVIIFILAAAGRVLQKIYYTTPGGDKAYQILATKNLLNGRGISTLEVFAGNLTDPQYVSLIKWPPGYSLLLAPFYELSGENFFWGSLWPDLIAAILFVWFARKTISLFKVPVYLVNFYTLVAGFCMYNFCTSSSSDLITATFYEIALFLTLRFILSEKKNYRAAFVISLMLFICGFTRYMSLPLAYIIPLYFIASGYINRDRKYVMSGLFMLGVLILLTAALLLYQDSQAGSAVYFVQSQKGFYPENLLKMNPFIFSSFFNMNFLCTQLEKISGIPFMTIAGAFCIIHLVLFAGVVVLALYWMKKRTLSNPSLFNHFINIGVLSTLGVVAMLGYLSVTNSAYPITGTDNWTFIQEGRYYFIPILFIQLSVLVAAWKFREQVKKWVYKLLSLLLFILFTDLLHSAYFTAKIILHPGGSLYKSQEEFETMQYFKALLKKTMQENPGKHIVVSCVDDTYTHYAGLWYDLPGLADYYKLNTLQLASSKETVVIVPIRERDKQKLTGFINNPEVKIVGKISDYIFYKKYVNPGGQ